MEKEKPYQPETADIDITIDPESIKHNEDSNSKEKIKEIRKIAIKYEKGEVEAEELFELIKDFPVIYSGEHTDIVGGVYSETKLISGAGYIDIRNFEKGPSGFKEDETKRIEFTPFIEIKSVSSVNRYNIESIILNLDQDESFYERINFPIEHYHNRSGDIGEEDELGVITEEDKKKGIRLKELLDNKIKSERESREVELIRENFTITDETVIINKKRHRRVIQTGNYFRDKCHGSFKDDDVFYVNEESGLLVFGNHKNDPNSLYFAGPIMYVDNDRYGIYDRTLNFKKSL